MTRPLFSYSPLFSSPILEIEVGTDTPTTRSLVTPWFNQTGKGVQDKLPNGVKGLEPKLIREVKIE